MSLPPAIDFDHAPWRFAAEADAAQRADQAQFQAALGARPGHTLGPGLYLSPRAAYDCESLAIGATSWVAAGVLLHGRLEIGRRCSLNPGCTVRGRVRLGDDVRIAYQAHLIGFGHGIDDTTRPIAEQPLDSRGIVVGDDVWIGAGAIVLDGVTLGAHCVVGAGAVVTHDVPAWAVVAGNPARVLRDRRAPPRETLARRLRNFGGRVAGDWPQVLAAAVAPGPDGAPAYRDDLSGPLRPWCDAVEIAAMFGERPPLRPEEDLVRRLRDAQDPATGLVPARPGAAPTLDDPAARYGLLATGYALECLRRPLRHPVQAVAALTPEALRRAVDALPWRHAAWDAGDWVDTVGSAIVFNRRHFGLPTVLAGPLVQALAARAAPHTGLWGEGDAARGWRQPVNGSYRLVRGSYALFGLPLPHPEAMIDTLLAHARQHAGFAETGDACDRLDLVHLLGQAGRQTGHRRDEVRRVLEALLEALLPRWVPGRGLAFDAGADPSTPAGRPGLQGTEMGLAIVYTAAAALGLEVELGYAPQGIHRLGPPPPLVPEPA